MESTDRVSQFILSNNISFEQICFRIHMHEGGGTLYNGIVIMTS